MAKPSKKKAAAKKPARQLAKRSGKKSGKKVQPAKSKGELTILAVVLMAVTLFWTLGAGSFAVSDVFDRRASCQEWLVQAGSGEQGWRRVYDRQSERKGCSITKLGLKGYMANRPIYPNFQWLFIVFGIPVVLMLTYVFLLKFKRSWILGRKKKIWALTGPLDLDDYEDMREFPDSAEEVIVVEEKKAKPEAAAAPAPDKTPTPDASAPAPAGKPQQSKQPKQKSEEVEGELTEFEKMLRQVDD